MTDEYNYVADAVDTVTAKLAIIMKARELNVPVISSMGTGNKLHPEMLEITDVFKTSVCPLAKVMRKELKDRGIKKLKVCYKQRNTFETFSFRRSNQQTLNAGKYQLCS